MSLPDDFLYKLKENNPIETVMSSYTNLIRQGRDYVCLCPFHSEKTPSCRVYTSDPHFYCFGCGAGGDVVTFIKRAENLEYMEAIRFLAEKCGMQVPEDEKNKQQFNFRKRIYEINRETARFFYKNLVSGNDKRGLLYFSSRKLRPETVKKYGLGFAPDSWDSLYKHLCSLGFSDYEIVTSNVCRRSNRNPERIYDSFRNRVIFPIIDLRGNIIAFGGRVLDVSLPKYINSSDTPVFNKSRNLFSLNFAKNSSSKRLILAEGYMDVIALNQAGFENTVATLGTALTQEQARIMRNYADEVVIAYDSDSAGQTATQRAVNLLGNVGITVKIIKMEGAKDPDEYIKKYGVERFRLLLDHSDGAVNFQLGKCREGLDINSDTGKVEFLRRSSKVLAEISNPLERDVYISRTANDCGISVEVLKANIEIQLKRKNYSKKQNQWRTVKNTQVMRDVINPEADVYPKESKAEEMLIVYLLRNPDKLEEIDMLITPQDFLTSFNRRVFECMCRKLKEFSSVSLSMFSDEFNNSEMGRITEMNVKNKEILIDNQTVNDCIAVIKNFNNNKIDDKKIVSDEELIALQQSLMNINSDD